MFNPDSLINLNIFLNAHLSNKIGYKENRIEIKNIDSGGSEFNFYMSTKINNNNNNIFALDP